MENHKTIQIKTKRGFILNAFEGDSITQEIQKKGEYDANTLESLNEVLAAIQPQTSLDVGANIGNHALLISRFSKNLIAFEPVGFIFEVLQSNLIQNHIANAQAVNSGLSDTALEREIFIPQNGNLGSSSLEATNGTGQRLKINTIIGDDYLQKNLSGARIDFIKMDVEGHEAAALQGLKATIRAFQPLLLLEWKSPQTISAFKDHDLFNDLFSQYSFYSLSYTSNKKAHPKSLWGFLKRIYYRLFAKKWCLSGFERKKYYSNVYFVPSRYKSIFEKFIHLSC
ncbi:MAG: FkbM family methyltransferase [Methylotenera sp.]